MMSEATPVKTETTPAAAAAPQAETTVVFVSNLSPAANEKTVTDFFSFCGEIKSLVLRKKENEDTQEAIVTFESAAAAKTSILLSNALIVDRAIIVRSYNPATDSKQTDAAATIPKDKIEQKNFGGVPDAQRSKLSVVASMLAAGYVLGEDIKKQASEADEKYQFTAQVKVAAESLDKTIRETATNIDKTLHIKENVEKATTYVSEQFKTVDQSLGLTAKATVAKEEAVKLATRIGETPAVVTAMGWLNSIGTAVKETYTEVRAETTAAIDAKHLERGITASTAPAPVTTEAVPADAPADAPAAVSEPTPAPAPAPTTEAAPATEPQK